MYSDFQMGSSFKKNSSCPLCDSLAYQDSGQPFGPHLFVCSICGRYRLTEFARTFINQLPDTDKSLRYKASYALRKLSEVGRKSPSIDLYPIYQPEEMRNLMLKSDPSVQEKMDLLLDWIAENSKFPGDQVLLDLSSDYSIFCCANYKEASFYFGSLHAQGLLQSQTNNLVTLTTSGWLNIESRRMQGANSTNAFIAMSFDKSRTSYAEAIERSIKASGYTSIHMGHLEHVNRIDDEIIARIRQSKFLIADFTGQNNGVYFEAGFMLGLGRQVIWLCEKSDLENVHFDTRQYNTIDYVDAPDLEKRLSFRIQALFGKGPHSEG